MKNKLHIIISDDLEPVYGCVQGGHAIAQWMMDNKDNPVWSNDYLIFLRGKLEDVMNLLEYRNVPYSSFNEPDLNNQLTALAVHGHDNLFKKLKLA